MPRLRLGRPASFADACSRATLVLTLVTVLSNVYRRIVLDATDPYKCGALLTHGQWLDSPDRQPDHTPFLNWHPPGCMLYEYKTPEIASCNEDGKILFVGDTVTRQIFWATARKIEGNSQWVFHKRAELDTHSDIEYSANGANLKFIWDPWLNGSTLHEELNAFRERRAPVSGEREVLSEGASEDTLRDRKSVVMLLGGGLWFARHLEDPLTQFKASVDFITSAAYDKSTIANLKEETTSGNQGVGDQILFTPVLEPQYDRLTPSRVATITPDKISAMNGYLEQQSLQGVNVLWSFTNMTRSRPETYGESGLHVIDTVATRMADVVLNLRCNSKAAQREGYPFSRTCCSSYRPTNLVQILGIFAALVVLPVAVLRTRGTSIHTDAHSLKSNNLSQRGFSGVLSGETSSSATLSAPLALLILLLSICYCFVADRTQVFDKFPKEFSNLDFRVMLAIGIVGCLLFIKPIPATPNRRHSVPSESFSRSTFLPRVQSDEFKGWMQIYILIYGYTGASNVLDFYEVLRVFLALYLFLSGYGHAIYFLEKKDYSLQRVASVLFRLNMLPVLLSFMMDRPYNSYYFAPLVSFWFLIVYLTLRPALHYNDSLGYVLGKMVISAIMVTCFIHIPGILELSFAVLRVTCRANLRVEDWRFRLGMDKYVVYAGIMVAFVHLRVSSVLNTPQGRLSGFSRIIHDYFDVLKRFSVYLSVITIPAFWILTRRLRSKEDYNWWMPFIAWLPAVSFVVLRNATQFFRSYHCASFARVGRISLELYLLSNHIWLAGDGHGILRAAFRSADGGFLTDRWRDLLILTLIFVWLAGKVSEATAVIVTWIMGGENEEVKQETLTSSHGRNLSELQFPDYDNALPRPRTQAMNEQGNDRRGISSLPADLRKRLVILVVVVWIGNLFYT